MRGFVTSVDQRCISCMGKLETGNTRSVFAAELCIFEKFTP